MPTLSPSRRSFAHELVRHHRTFERIYRLARRAASALVASLTPPRSLVVTVRHPPPHTHTATWLDSHAPPQTIEHVGSLSDAANLSADEALAIVRKMQGAVDASAKASLLRPPPPTTPHEQSAFSQGLLRVLLSTCRTDGSFAPHPFEALVGPGGETASR